MSKILANSREDFDKFSILRWQDIKIGRNEIIVTVNKPNAVKYWRKFFFSNSKTITGVNTGKLTL
jgi:hypothetical protein